MLNSRCRRFFGVGSSCSVVGTDSALFHTNPVSALAPAGGTQRVTNTDPVPVAVLTWHRHGLLLRLLFFLPLLLFFVLRIRIRNNYSIQIDVLNAVCLNRIKALQRVVESRRSGGESVESVDGESAASRTAVVFDTSSDVFTIVFKLWLLLHCWMET
jgi:hypothetical protein